MHHTVHNAQYALLGLLWFDLSRIWLVFMQQNGQNISIMGHSLFDVIVLFVGMGFGEMKEQLTIVCQHLSKLWELEDIILYVYIPLSWTNSSWYHFHSRTTLI